jgi:hypothetical protein
MEITKGDIMLIYQTEINRAESLYLKSSKDKVMKELCTFAKNKWLDGVIINFGKINTSLTDFDLNLHVQIEYIEILDENYLKEKERLELGL